MSDVIQENLLEWNKSISKGAGPKHWADSDHNAKRFMNKAEALGLSTGDVALALEVDRNVQEFKGTFTEAFVRLEQFAEMQGSDFPPEDEEFDPAYEPRPDIKTSVHYVTEPEVDVNYATLPLAAPTLTDLMAQLSEPFDPDLVEWKPQATYQDKALAMAYADPRAYIDRLNEVAGKRWSDDYDLFDGGRVMLCKLTVCGVTRSDVGEAELGDKNMATSALAQAFKRACVKFGLGRYLYSLPKTWVEYDPEKKRLTQRALQELDRLLRTQAPAKPDDDGAEPPLLDKGLEWARALKTTKGTAFGELNADQLQWILDNRDKTTDDQYKAADILIGEMEKAGG